MTVIRNCWCSDQAPEAFTADYGLCKNCGTLVSRSSLPDEAYRVSDDETDFYGKKYWLEHQGADLGYPNIFERSRSDLAGRNLHWLRTLLQYKGPPARVLELGCSHGSFVALLKMAGYDARGMEMSPWVVDYAKSTFDIPMLLGPIEAGVENREMFDAIVLMDVLEHLPSPKETLTTALNILKPDGLMMIQMPQFPGVSTFEELQAAHASFLGMLLPDEHIYLYTQGSAQRLLRELGAEHMIFEKPFFSEHDMFFVVSRQPLNATDGTAATKLLETPRGRFALALLDQRSQIDKLEEQVKIIDADRQERLENLLYLDNYAKSADADRAEKMDAVARLQAHIDEINADRAARLEQIHTLTKMVVDLQNAAKN